MNRFLSVLDQGIWALRSLLLVVMVARLTDAEEFGLFGVGLSALIVISGTGAAMAGEVVAVTRGSLLRLDRKGPSSDSAIARIGERGLGSVLILAFVAPVAIWMMGDAFGVADANEAFLWLVFGSPAAVFAEGCRALMYGMGQGEFAYQVSSVWLLIQSLALVGQLLGWSVELSAVMLCWVIGATVAGVLVILRLRLRPAWHGASKSEWGRRRDFIGQFLLTAGPSHATLIVAGIVGGLPAAGAIRALQSVFGPLNVVIGGLGNSMVPRVSRNPESALGIGRRVAVATSGLGIAITGLLMLKPALGTLLMGQSWPASIWLVCAFGLGRIAHAATFSALLVYRAADWGRQSSWLRVGTALTLVGSFYFGCLDSLETGLWASGSAAVLACAFWWIFAPRVNDLVPTDSD